MNTEARTNGITGSITVTVNEAAGQAAIERAKSLLAGIPGGVEKAMKASMSRTVDRLRRESNEAIREKYDITATATRTVCRRPSPSPGARYRCTVSAGPIQRSLLRTSRREESQSW